METPQQLTPLLPRRNTKMDCKFKDLVVGSDLQYRSVDVQSMPKEGI